MRFWKEACLLVAAFALAFSFSAAAQNGKKAPAGKGDAAKGKQVFADNCDICHNADSAEDKVGPGLKGLYQKPAHKMADGAEIKQVTDEFVRKQIKEGSSAMPPVGASLSDAEMDDLLAYLHTL